MTTLPVILLIIIFLCGIIINCLVFTFLAVIRDEIMNHHYRLKEIENRHHDNIETRVSEALSDKCE